MTAEDLPHAAAFTAAEGWSSETLTTFESCFAHDPASYLIAEEGGRPTGICIATSFGKAGFVGELIIRLEQRNRGKGRRLLKHAIGLLRDRASATSTSMVWSGRCRSMSAWGSAGSAAPCALPGTWPTPPPDPEVRMMTDDDLPAVIRLDRDAFGDDRSFFLNWFLHRTPELCLVLDQGQGSRGGFILGRYGDGSLAAARVEALGLSRHPDPPWHMVLGQQHGLGVSQLSWAVGSAAKG